MDLNQNELEALGLGLNVDALRASRYVAEPAADNDLARRIAAEVTARIKVADPPVVGKLLIDTSERGQGNEDMLSLKLLRLNRWVGATDHDGATGEDVSKCRAFPQKKYVERTDEYLVPVTPGNVDHLLASWRVGEYQLTPGAKLMLDVYFSQQQAAGTHLSERARFLAEGVAPQLDDYVYVDGKPPYPHQAVAFSSSRHAEFFFDVMDPGTGKTRVEIDVACDNARRRRREWIVAHGGPADADVNLAWQDEATGEYAPQYRWLIVAPKSVCRTWIKQLGEWATLDVNVERLSGTYTQEDGSVVRASNKLQRAGLLMTLLSDKTTPLLVAVINYDGLEVIEDYLRTPDGRQVWDRMTCDESIAIKNPDSQRAKTVYRVAAGAKTRAALNGTPISKNILDLYGQCHFLKPGMLGYTSKHAFDQYFGEQSYFGGHASYRKEKLPELLELLAKHSFIIRRDQCLKLPPQIREVVEPEMGDEQRAAYVSMAEQMLVDLDKVAAGETLSTDEATKRELRLMMGDLDESKVSFTHWVLVRMVRLAQITSGFLTMKDGSLHVFKEQPKLDALEDHLASLHDNQRIVVWSRFRTEIEQVVARLKDEYGAAAIYGEVKDRDREQRLDAHEKGKYLPGHKAPCRVLVIQPQSGGFGLNELIGTTDVNFLSNEWPWMYRKQAEDRTMRAGVELPVLYNDYVIPSTIDELHMERLSQRRELSDLITSPQTIIRALQSQLGAIKAK